MQQHELFLPLPSPSPAWSRAGQGDKDITHRPPPWEGVPKLAAIPQRPWRATGHQIGATEGENFTSSLQHVGLLLPRSLLLVAMLSVRARPRRAGTDYPPARFLPALAATGSQQSNATSNVSQPVSYSACQVQLNTGADRGGIAALATAPCSLRWLGGKATQGGANPPGFYREGV